MALTISFPADDVAVAGGCNQLPRPSNFSLHQHQPDHRQIKPLRTGTGSSSSDQKLASLLRSDLLHRQDRSLIHYKDGADNERLSTFDQPEGGGGCPPPHRQDPFYRPSSAIVRRDTVTVDIASLLKRSDSNESHVSPSPSQQQSQPKQQQEQPSPPPPQQQSQLPAALPPVQYHFQGVQDQSRSSSLPPPQSFQTTSAVSSTPSPASAPGTHPFPPSTTAVPVTTAATLHVLLPPVLFPAFTGPQTVPPKGGPGLSATGVAKRSMPPYTIDSPAKKQSKWSAEEDSLIIELRGSGMKWEDISKRLPGRSAISCRLHYQNYLERRSEWDEERKNKLARLYERYVERRKATNRTKVLTSEFRFKPDMWAKVAEEMQVPWRAAEAMHWQLGEADMARRAGVTPFSLTATTIEASSSGHHRRSPSHSSYQQHPQAHSHHHSQGGFRTDTGSAGGSSSSGAPSPRYGRGGNPPVPLPPPPPMSMHGDRLVTGLGVSSGSSGRGFGSSGRRDRGGTPSRGGSSFGGGPSDPANAMYHYHQHNPQQHQHAGPGLPPIQTGGGPPPLQPQERAGGSGALPSFAEITTGVSPYSTPAYSLGASPAPSNTDSPGPSAGHGFLAYSTGGYGVATGPEPPTSAGAAGKRRASPNVELREHRRRYLQSPRYDDGKGGGSSGSGFHRG